MWPTYFPAFFRKQPKKVSMSSSEERVAMHGNLEKGGKE
jgi:hypothetical protein